MKRSISFLLSFLLGLLLCSCSPSEIRTIDLANPSLANHASYTGTPTINELIENSTHIAIVDLVDIQSHWTNSHESIFLFSVLSMLAGENYTETISVINESGFYEYGETYILFLNLVSSTLQPFDYYIPFHRFTFRITEGEEIYCLQSIADAETETPRSFVKPFENPEYNRLRFLEKFIMRHSHSVKKTNLASEDKDLNNLLNKADLVMEIVPTQIESTDSFIVDVWYEVSNCLKGNPPSDNWLMLPHGIELDKKYIVLLYKDQLGNYRLVSRNSFFIQGSQEYEDLLITWDKE